MDCCVVAFVVPPSAYTPYAYPVPPVEPDVTLTTHTRALAVVVVVPGKYIPAMFALELAALVNCSVTSSMRVLSLIVINFVSPVTPVAPIVTVWALRPRMEHFAGILIGPS